MYVDGIVTPSKTPGSAKILQALFEDAAHLTQFKGAVSFTSLLRLSLGEDWYHFEIKDWKQREAASVEAQQLTHCLIHPKTGG